MAIPTNFPNSSPPKQRSALDGVSFGVMMIHNFLFKQIDFDIVKPNDFVFGRLKNPTTIFDLERQGVTIYPSPLSQFVSDDKLSQVDILKEYMIPRTYVARSKKELIEVGHQLLGPVITKLASGGCGLGVQQWNSSLDAVNYFFDKMDSIPGIVMQPYVPKYDDVRVIVIGPFVFGYQRQNGNNLRQNISLGATPKRFSVSPELNAFCRSAMIKADFPYAHLDIMVNVSFAPESQLINGINEDFYLTEISLNGSLKGLDGVTPQEVNAMKENVLLEKAGGKIAESLHWVHKKAS